MLHELLNFVSQLIRYYPPEYVSLYILMGLGVEMAKMSKVKIPVKDCQEVLIAILVGIPVGIFMGFVVIAFWPAYFMGIIYNKISK